MYVGYQTEKFTLPVLPLAVLVRRGPEICMFPQFIADLFYVTTSLLTSLGRTFQPGVFFYLFLLFLLKHTQNPLLVFLEPSSLPQKILFSWLLFCFVLSLHSLHWQPCRPAPSPFRFRRRPSSSSATVNVVVAATATPAVAAAVGSSPLSSSLLRPLFCLRRHRPDRKSVV